MNLYRKLRRWWRNRQYPPTVVIQYYGQATTRPHVDVSVCSIDGAQGVYSWEKTDVGEASATLYGTGLARIMQCRLVDRRGPIAVNSELSSPPTTANTDRGDQHGS